jgi:CelD/BcsL family acetyltransferase involved in cellulose biosynthesis
MALIDPHSSCEDTSLLSATTYGSLRTVTVRDFDALNPHRDAWGRLAWQAPQQLQTLLPDWMEVSFRYGRKSDEQWLCIFAYAGDRLVGVLPVFISPHRVLGRSWPHLQTCDRHSDYGDIVLAPGHATAALNVLLAELGRQVPSHTGLDLPMVQKDSPIWTSLQNGLEGYVMRRGALFRGSILDVRGDFNSYLATLSNMRINLKRYRKKLEKRGRVSIEIRKGASASTSAEFLKEFLVLDASGWKGRGGTALLNQPDSVAFHTALITNFAAQGCFEWYAVRVDDRLVVARIALRCGRSLLLPKIAFDEDFAECRLGSIVTEETFRDAFSRPEIDELNLCSASEAHHYWHLPQREYVDVHLVRQSALGMAGRLPSVLMRSTYQTHVRPRIPTSLRRAWHQFRRRGGLKPRRAADINLLNREPEDQKSVNDIVSH